MPTLDISKKWAKDTENLSSPIRIKTKEKQPIKVINDAWSYAIRYGTYLGSVEASNLPWAIVLWDWYFEPVIVELNTIELDPTTTCCKCSNYLYHYKQDKPYCRSCFFKA